MKNRILKIVIAIFLIIAITMSDFALLGMNIRTYAVVSKSDSTNNENVKFTAYFQTNEEKVTKKQYPVNDTNMKLYMEVSVLEEGYFDGIVTLNNSNFNIKQELLSDSISKIEQNTITLKRINAGDTATIEVAIEPKTEEDYSLDLLNMESKILLSGIYKDSSEKDINIKAEKAVTLSLLAPEDLKANLQTKLITNRIYKIGDAKKRLIQIEITSSVEQNSFPVKSSRFEIETIPNLEKVQVLSKGTYTTNGKKEELLSDADYIYDATKNVLNFTIQNNENQGKISWRKSGADTIIVTFILNSDTSLPDKEFTIRANLSFYGSEEKNLENSGKYSLKEADGIFKATVSNEEKYIYKGKIYSKEEREYNTTTNLEVNYASLAYNIKINQTTLYGTDSEEKSSNIEYKTTTISKAEFERVLGENGTLTIKDQSGNVIKEITSKTEANSEGNIVINYAGGVKALNIETSTPVNVGIIRLSHVKVIKAENYSRQEIQGLKQLIERVVTKYNSQENNIAEYTYERKMTLSETETKVDLLVEPRTLSTVTTNEQVKIAMTLRTDTEMYDLFKNPTLKIKLPNSVKSVSNIAVTPLYLENFDIQSTNYSNETKELIIALKGEQTKYTTSNTQSYVEIKADIELEETTPNGKDKIELTYTNENAFFYNNDGKTEKTVQISGITGLIAYYNITSENIKTNSALTTEESLAEIPVNSASRQINFQTVLVNNSSSIINNAIVKGILPLKGSTELGENNIDATLVDAITVSMANAKVYYSANSKASTDLSDINNGWSEDINTVQNPILYMIIIPELGSRQRLEANYTVQIPAGLEYNKTLKTSYTVDYKTEQDTRKVKSAIVGVTTGIGANLVTTLSATVGTDTINNESIVKAGEVIKYEIAVTNNGNEKAYNVTVKGLVPEGTVFVKPMEDFVYAEPISLYYEEDEKLKQVEAKFENIEVGETKTIEYEVRVKNDVKTSVATNKATVIYNEVLKTSSNEITNKLDSGSIRVTIKRRTDTSVLAVNKQPICYFAIVENITDLEVKDVKLALNIPEEFDYTQLVDTSNDKIMELTKNISISSIRAGEAKVYEIFTTVKDNTENAKDTIITAIATHEDKQYRANTYSEIVYGYNVDITMTGSHQGEYLKVGDTIEFEIIVTNNSKVAIFGHTVKTNLPEELIINKIIIDGQEIDVENENYIIRELAGLEAGKTTSIKISAIVRNSLTRAETKKISALASLIYAGETIKTTEPIIYYLSAIEEPKPDIPVLPEDPNNPVTEPENPNNPDNPPAEPENPNNPNNPPVEPENPNNPDNTNKPTTKKYNISGRAWVDQDKNGSFDNQDKSLPNIVVKLLNIETNEFVRNTEENKDLISTTDEDGYYDFKDIEEGRYIVVFEYDNTLYKPTTYQKADIEESKNSNVLSKTLSIKDEEKEYAITDEIQLNKDMSNINLGLVFVKQFDIKIEKYVSKVIVQTNKETKTYDYNQANLARVEISAKRIIGSTMIVQYSIKATNVGDVDAYIDTLVDYAPNGFKFNSELNTDWYESEGNLYTSALARTAIAPGESKEINLTLTKTKQDGNAELINNTAEICEAYNLYGIADANSTGKNKNLEENDIGSADLLVGIQTGSAFNYIALVISMLAVIGVGVYLINKKVLHVHVKF